jgi:hypothetical protein
VPCPSNSAAHTKVLTAKDKVAAISAPENKREYRAPDIAVMRCDFVGYISEALSVPRARVSHLIITCSFLASCREQAPLARIRLGVAFVVLRLTCNSPGLRFREREAAIHSAVADLHLAGHEETAIHIVNLIVQG